MSSRNTVFIALVLAAVAAPSVFAAPLHAPLRSRSLALNADNIYAREDATHLLSRDPKEGKAPPAEAVPTVSKTDSTKSGPSSTVGVTTTSNPPPDTNSGTSKAATMGSSPTSSKISDGPLSDKPKAGGLNEESPPAGPDTLPTIGSLENTITQSETDPEKLVQAAMLYPGLVNDYTPEQIQIIQDHHVKKQRTKSEIQPNRSSADALLTTSSNESSTGKPSGGSASGKTLPESANGESPLKGAGVTSSTPISPVTGAVNSAGRPKREEVARALHARDILQ